VNFVYVHLNRVIRERDFDCIYVAGPGHGRPGLVANTYLEAPTARSIPTCPGTHPGCSGCSSSSRSPGAAAVARILGAVGAVPEVVVMPAGAGRGRQQRDDRGEGSGALVEGPQQRPEQDIQRRAQLLAVKPSWIYEAVLSGTLPSMRIGRHICFIRTMREEWLQGRVA
jgi:excisionase family DNA binding protein